MKSKAPLVMMEQLVMVLVFALASALCLQTFVLSGKISQMTEVKNRAMVEAQNVAETLKNGETAETKFYTGEWQLTRDEVLAEYRMTVSYKEPAELPVWEAEIAMTTAEGEELVRIPVAGQTEVEQ